MYFVWCVIYYTLYLWSADELESSQNIIRESEARCATITSMAQRVKDISAKLDTQKELNETATST